MSARLGTWPRAASLEALFSSGDAGRAHVPLPIVSVGLADKP